MEASWRTQSSQVVPVVPSLSCVQLFVTPWTAAHQASLSFTSSQNLFKFMSTDSVMPSKHLILRHPLLLLPSIFPSIRVFFNESVVRIRWSKYWNDSFSISPSSEYSVLISFRIDWFHLAVQGTLKSLLQHHSSKASTLQHSAFFTVQVALMVKNLPANRRGIRDAGLNLGQKDPLEKEMATHSSTLAWRIPCTEEPGGLQSTGAGRVGYDWSELAQHYMTQQSHS